VRALSSPKSDRILEQRRLAALASAVNVANNLGKRLDQRRNDVRRFTDQLRIAEQLRPFMQYLHQQAKIKYTISVERDEKESLLVEAK
jgi:hypothetical protein